LVPEEKVKHPTPRRREPNDVGVAMTRAYDKLIDASAKRIRPPGLLLSPYYVQLIQTLRPGMVDCGARNRNGHGTE
jgi:hypothetical protein